MIDAIPDSLITGYEVTVPGLSLPDENDRHVLAAAIHCNADKIITANLKDFPDAALAPHNCEAQHPDDFLMELLDIDFSSAVSTLTTDRTHYRNPPYSVNEYLNRLNGQGLTKTVTFLNKNAKSLL